MNGRWLVLVSVVMLSSSDDLPAQLFSPLQSLRSNTVLQNAGGLSGDRRFLRSNRRRDDFVGRDVDAGRGFVGETRGRTEGRIPPATLTLQEEVVVNVNTPLPAPSRSGIYPPRLRLAFVVSSPAETIPSGRVQERLSQALGRQPGVLIEVEVSGRTATLRGEVASSQQREMAVLLAGFEPGVEQVRNELQVREPPSRSLPAESPDDPLH